MSSIKVRLAAPIQPDSIVDGEVTDGTIEIEGYRVTIVDGSVSDVNVIK